jgi:hypothetical protein
MFIKAIKEDKNTLLQYFLTHSIEEMEKNPDPDDEKVDIDTLNYIKNILENSI